MLKTLRKYHWVSLAVAFIAANNVVAPTFSLANSYYIVMGIALAILIMKGGIRGMKGAYMAFVIVCALSIVFNDVPAVFRPWLRLLTFIFVSGLVSPWLQSPTLRRFRVEAFVIMQYLLLAITIISFFTDMAGIRYNNPYHVSDLSLISGHSGITSQQMIMGPVAGISLIFCIYQLWIQKSRRLKTLEKGIYFLGLFCGFAMNLLAVSRAGVAAAAMGVVALMVYKSRFRMGRAMWYSAIIVGLLGASYPLWSGYSEKVVEKQEGYNEKGDALGSRMMYWNKSLREFEDSPILGIGFASVSLGESKNMSEDEMTGNGQVETGSGWLNVLSMTGIAGFSLFVFFFLTAFRKTIQSVKRNYCEPYCLIGALLVLMCTHMLAEGYSLAAGGLLFFNLWLLLGVADAWPQDKRTIAL